MRIILNNLCSKRLETKANGHLDSNEPKKNNRDPQLWRDILAYWILGLACEFGYVVIISAAHDILYGFDGSSNTVPAESRSTAGSLNSIRQSVCAAPSTGVLLIADILPSVLMNISCPFLPLVKNFRMAVVVLLNLTSFLLISNSDSEHMAIIGVACTSLALGIGEVTQLSYSARFNKKVITAWASGTGSAGIIGSISWAGLIALGITPRDTLRLMLVVPLIQAVTFWILLRSPRDRTTEAGIVNIATIESINCTSQNIQPNTEEKFSGLKAKLKFVPKLAGFITPLVIVFIFEYICVSGLFELLHVHDEWLEPSSQYRWFLVIYQIGVFTSRTLGSLIKPRRTWWATFVQFANASCFLYMASTSNIPSAWIVFMFVFALGAVGGVCYVHTFHRLVKELPSNRHKFSLGMIIIAESIGIAIAGFTAIPLHNVICGRAILS